MTSSTERPFYYSRLPTVNWVSHFVRLWNRKGLKHAESEEQKMWKKHLDKKEFSLIQLHVGDSLRMYNYQVRNPYRVIYWMKYFLFHALLFAFLSLDFSSIHSKKNFSDNVIPRRELCSSKLFFPVDFFL